MVVQPRFRNNIFLNAHPVGCAVEVQNQIDYVKSQKAINGPSNVLVVGASTGYGLASRIVAAFGAKASTIGVGFEKEGSEKRTATAGWYNMQAFDKEASAAGLVSESINGDAFSDEVKQETIERIKRHDMSIDLVVYSLGAPVRTDPKTGEFYRSVLKPIGASYTRKSVDLWNGEEKEFTIEPALPEEIDATVKVMGGEDWELWIQALKSAGVISEGVVTVAFSYVGPEMTHAIYRAGTMGKAKEHLEKTAGVLNGSLAQLHGKAFVSINKGIVTRSSAVIPVMPLYIALLFKVMKEKGIHEDSIEQMYRLFADRLYAGGDVPVDEEGRIRIDDLEMRDDVQGAIASKWNSVTVDNVEEVTDAAGYRRDFFRIHGFDVDGVDYDADVAI